MTDHDGDTITCLLLVAVIAVQGLYRALPDNTAWSPCDKSIRTISVKTSQRNAVMHKDVSHGTGEKNGRKSYEQ